MSSNSGPSLAHRSISNIRTHESGSSGLGGSPGPNTPSRAISSTFGSPSSLRAEEDTVVVEIGSRVMRLGFAGEPTPKAVLSLGPELQRRVGDFRDWDPEQQDNWRRRPTRKAWGEDHELWQYDVRSLDLGLVEDKIDRAIREALTKFLLIDSRPRRTALVLSSSVPLPLVSAALDVLFHRYQAPTVSLLSAAVMSTLGAGMRSALVVDLGWAETVVTSVYEYREMRTSRTVRSGKMLVDKVHDFIQGRLSMSPTHAPDVDRDKKQNQHSVSFEECEEVACRLVWCRQVEKPCMPTSRGRHDQQLGDGLPTVEEQDEFAQVSGLPSLVVPSEAIDATVTVEVPLRCVSPPERLDVTLEQLSELCEKTFLAASFSRGSFDDHENSVHHLVYQHLLRLPVDARGECMSRIIFTGGCSRIVGLRRRILDELSRLVHERGWDPVDGSAPVQYKTNIRLRKTADRKALDNASTTTPFADKVVRQEGTEQPVCGNAGDAMEERLKKRDEDRHRVQGQLRSLESMGPWSGASLACQLKVAATANVDREVWLQQGIIGAGRPNDVDGKTQQRQSMGPGGMMRGTAGGQANWTLGAWGVI